MLTRLNPFIVVRAHWRSLQNRTPSSTTPDLAARWALGALPTAAALLVLLTETRLTNPGALVSALALFSAGLLAAFAQLASIRGRYPGPDTDYDPDRLTRAMLDEAIAHILTAALISVTSAFTIVVGMNVGTAGGQSLPLGFSVPIAAAGVYLLLVFVMTVRKLFGAYVVANDVDLTGTRR